MTNVGIMINKFSLLMSYFLMSVICLIASATTAYSQVTRHYFTAPADSAYQRFLNVRNPDIPIETMPGRAEGVTLVKTYNLARKSMIIQVMYKVKGSSQSSLLADIIVKEQSDGGKKTTVIHSQSGGTYVNRLSLEEVLSYGFLSSRISEIEMERAEIVFDLYKKSGDELLDVALFSYRSLKDLIKITEEFDAAIDEALEIQAHLDVNDPIDRMISNYISINLKNVFEARHSEIRNARLALLGWGLLDGATLGSKGLLKGAAELWGEAALLASESKFVRVSTALMSRTYRSAEKIGEKALRPLKIGAAKAGFLGVLARVKARTQVLRSFSAATKLIPGKLGKLKVLTAEFLARHPKLKDFLDVSDAISLEPMTDQSRRLFIANVVYSGAFFSLTRMQELKDRPRDFIYDFITNGLISNVVINRLTAHVPFKTVAMPWFREWKARQFLYHLQTTMDTTAQYFKLVSETQSYGLSGEDFEYVRKRLLANLTYTLIRGPMMGNMSDGNARVLNNIIVDAQKSGQLQVVLTQTTREFMSRLGVSTFSGGVFVFYRNGFTDQAEDLLSESLHDDIKYVAQMLKDGKKDQIQPFQLPSGLEIIKSDTAK